MLAPIIGVLDHAVHTEAASATNWGPLLWALLCIAGVMALVRIAGEVLAATHPEPAAKKTPAAKGGVPAATATLVCSPTPGIEPEMMAAVGAAIATVVPGPHRILSIRSAAAKLHTVENMMQQWSMEGRRQIYSSHKVR